MYLTVFLLGKESFLRFATAQGHPPTVKTIDSKKRKGKKERFTEFVGNKFIT